MKQRGNSIAFSLVVVIIFVALLPACSQWHRSQNVHNNKLKVTTTTSMITDITREVGGQYVEVTGLMGAGIDPHLYKASQGDMRKLAEAQVILYNGLHLEGKMSNILEKMKKRKTVIAVTKQIPLSKLRFQDHSGNVHYDPHVWFNVELWISAVKTVTETLVQEDRAHAAQYNKQAEAYIRKLDKLHKEVIDQINTIPKSSRTLVTAHDAFGYYGDAYGLQVIGLQGFSTAAEYGAKDISKLRDFLIRHHIKSIFVESSIPAKAMEAIVAGAKEKGHVVTIGGQLFSDAMGEPGTEAGTYIGMVRHNTNTIVKALK